MPCLSARSATLEPPRIAVFQWGAVLLRRVGHDAMVLLALCAAAGRVAGYTRLTPGTVWWVLALEPLHGVTYGLAWTALVDKVRPWTELAVCVLVWTM